jgi:hypothetical protein
MTFRPHVWTADELLSPEQLTRIEAGIAAIVPSFRPHVWTADEVPPRAAQLTRIEAGIVAAGATGFRAHTWTSDETPAPPARLTAMEVALGGASGGGGGGGGTNLLQVPLTIMRNDGLSGTTRAIGRPKFAPGAVVVADLATATVWNGATEVACYVEDTGARHLGSANGAALLDTYLEVDRAFATAGELASYVLRFDRTPAVARLVKQGYSEFTNTLDLTLSADSTKFRINSALTAYPPNSDTPLRIAAQDIVFAQLAGLTNNPATAFPAPATLAYRRAVVTFTADSTGVVRAYLNNMVEVSAVTSVDPFVEPFWIRPSAVMPAGEGVIAWGIVYLASAAASITWGTTPLNGAGITTTLTASAVKPWSVLPTGFPAAIVANGDVAQMCASRFAHPSFDLQPAATERALGGTYNTHDLKRYQGSDNVWQRSGAWGLFSENGGGTAYMPTMNEWQLYARLGAVRNHRRALAVASALRSYQSINYTVGSGWQARNEANLDAANFLDYFALVAPLGGAAVDVSYAGSSLASQEYAQLYYAVNDPNTARNTMRWAMHCLQAFPRYDRYGVTCPAGVAIVATGTIKVNGVTINPQPSTGQEWPYFPSVGSYLTAATAYARWRRFWALVHDHMSTVGDSGYTGLRRLRVTDPNYADVVAFMQSWITSHATYGAAVYSATAPVSEMVTDIGDATTFLFTAKRLDIPAENLLYDASVAGLEQFAYSTAAVQGWPTAHAKIVADNGNPNGNGILIATLEWLYAQTGVAQWRIWRDTLYAALRNNGTTTDFYGKEQPESTAMACFVRAA